MAKALGDLLTELKFDVPAAGDPLAAVPTARPRGMVKDGNIDLHRRPVVRNPDGSISTVRSMSANFDGQEYLIPTVAADGSGILSEQGAIDQAKRTGQHLGVFDTPQNATAYAEGLHRDQAREYAKPKKPLAALLAENDFEVPQAPDKPWTDDLREIGRQVAGSVAVGVPEQAGQALKWASAPGQPAYATGQRWVDSAKARAPEWAPDMEGRGPIAGPLIEAAGQVGPSVAGALAAAPVIAGAAAAGAPGALLLGGGALLSALPMGMAQGQDTYERAKAAGADEATALAAGRKNQWIETAGETAGNAALGGLLGAGGRIVGRAAGGPIAAAVRSVTDPSVLKPFAKAAAKAYPIEMATEFGQAYGEGAVEQAAGVPGVDPLAEGLHGAKIAAGLTTLGLPFGVVGHAVQGRRNAAVAQALADPAVDPAERLRAAETVARQVDQVDRAAGAAVRANAIEAIAAGRALPVDDSLAVRAAAGGGADGAAGGAGADRVVDGAPGVVLGDAGSGVPRPGAGPVGDVGGGAPGAGAVSGRAGGELGSALGAAPPGIDPVTGEMLSAAPTPAPRGTIGRAADIAAASGATPAWTRPTATVVPNDPLAATPGAGPAAQASSTPAAAPSAMPRRAWEAVPDAAGGSQGFGIRSAPVGDERGTVFVSPGRDGTWELRAGTRLAQGGIKGAILREQYPDQASAQAGGEAWLAAWEAERAPTTGSAGQNEASTEAKPRGTWQKPEATFIPQSRETGPGGSPARATEQTDGEERRQGQTEALLKAEPPATGAPAWAKPTAQDRPDAERIVQNRTVKPKSRLAELIERRTGVQGERTPTTGQAWEWQKPGAEDTQGRQVGPFGPILRGYYHKPEAAIARLKELQSGDAIAALYHPEVGDIDLVWGETSDNPRAKGRGLAKLIRWHPEVLDGLQDKLLAMHVHQRHGDVLHLRGGSLRGVVKLTFDQKEKHWLLTAYDKEADSATGRTSALPDADAAEMNPAPSTSAADTPTIDHPENGQQVAGGDTGSEPAAEQNADAHPYKEGDRVVIRDSSVLAGRHGTVTKAETFGWTTVMPGAGARTSTREHYVAVKTDGGVAALALPVRFVERETGTAPAAVPDIEIEGTFFLPQNVFADIDRWRKAANGARAAAIRARKPESKREHLESAKQKDAKAEAYRAAFEAWGKAHPAEAAAASGGQWSAGGAAPTAPTAAPTQGKLLAAPQASKTKKGAAVWVVSILDRVERAEYERLKAEAEKHGGYWFGGRGVRGAVPGFTFSEEYLAQRFFNAIEAPEAAPVAVPDEPTLKPGEVRPDGSPYVYRRQGEQWQWQPVARGTPTTEMGDVGPAWRNLSPPPDFRATLERLLAEKWPEGAPETQAPAAETEPAQTETKPTTTETAAGIAQRWDAATPAERRELLRAVGYTDADQARVLSGTEWNQLGEAVRKALDAKPVAQPTEAPAAFGATNTVFTQSAADAARERLRQKLGTVRSGLDPELLQDGILLAGYYIEGGIREFGAWSQRMVADLGEAARPYLRAWYEGVRYYPGVDATGMTSAADIEARPQATTAAADNPGAGTRAEQDDDSQFTTTDRDGAASAAGQGADAVPGTEREGASGDVRGGAGGADAGGVRGADQPPADGDTQREESGGVPGAGPVDNLSGATDLGTDPGERSRISRGHDYRIQPGELTRQGSWLDAARRNVDAVELIARLEQEQRAATPEEQAQLVQFVGWGPGEIRNNLFPPHAGLGKNYNPWAARGKEWQALGERVKDVFTEDDWKTVARSTQYAHYTSEKIIRAIYAGLGRLGFAGGSVVEPGAGIGLFAGLMPDNLYQASTYLGIELDGFSAKIGQALFPSQTVRHADFTRQKLPKNFFDVAIGNPPFADIKVLSDPEYRKQKFLLHDYFFAKTLDSVRPGGLLVFVTSNGTLDKKATVARDYLSARADLLGAVRLPQTAFKQNAGTEVVTDVLFLKKRAAGAEPAGPAWQASVPIQVDGTEQFINEYYVAHPEMVLGVHSAEGTMYAGKSYTVKPLEGDIEDLFAQAVQRLPANVYSVFAPTVAPTTQQAKTIERDFNPKHRKEGGIYLNEAGDLLRVERGIGMPLVEVEPKLTAKERAFLTAYVPLRDALKQAHYDQLVEGDWQTSLQALNAAYDAFVAQHGPLTAFKVTERKELDEDGNTTLVETRKLNNERALRVDVEYTLALALEVTKEDGTIEKGPVLKDRVLKRPAPPKVETITDALAVSLAELGDFDLDQVARRFGVEPAEAAQQLGDLIYEQPSGGWVMADAYLSGDVKDKLELARVAAAHNRRFERNVTALEAVQPHVLGAGDISVQLGAAWIPEENVAQFAREVLGIAGAVVSYAKATGGWFVSGKAGKFVSRTGSAEWGTAYRSPTELLDAVLNKRQIRVYDTVKDGAGRTSTVFNETETVAANDMAKRIADEFASWVWTDAQRAGDLLTRYNETFNRYSPREFNGDHLNPPGLSLKYRLHPHQKRAVWRQIQTGNVYLAHAVGAGKTLEMIIGGMEQRRLGLIKKPMYVVPNHMLQQFAREFMEAYPAANILVADEQNFHLDNRRRFVAQAALNDPDAVVITHSAFRLLQLKPENKAAAFETILEDLRDQLMELDDDDQAQRRTRAQIEKRIERLEQQLEGKTNADKKDTALYFEDLGVDYLYVDEAHAYRKLDFATNLKVKGLSPEGSQQSLDMYAKTRWLDSQRPGRAFTFASGTPITNSMAEMYTVQRFFQDALMRAEGLHHFDAWASMFGRVAKFYERNATGGIEVVERFGKFVNVYDMMSRALEFMDVLTSSQLGTLIRVPDVRPGNAGRRELISVEQSENLGEYLSGELSRRLEASRQWKPTREQPNNPDPVIAIIGDGRLAAIDFRFVDPSLPDDKRSKLNRMCDEIIRIHDETAGLEYTDPDTGEVDPVRGATQIVFASNGFGEGVIKNRGFDSRAWVMKRFKEAGIPASQVAWIWDYKDAAKKEALFKEVRQGKKRILIGSPKNMGTGVNVQRRLIALHHLDAPWYPSDLEQPEGRIVRQGNQNREVQLYGYATDGTYDSTMWTMVSQKSGFIEQAFKGDRRLRTMDDISEASQYALAAAIASGDPRYMQLAELETDVTRLETLRKAHDSRQSSLKWDIGRAEREIDAQRAVITAAKAVATALEGQMFYSGYLSGEVDGRTFTKAKTSEVGDALLAAYKQVAEYAVGQVQDRAMRRKDRVKFPFEREIGTINGVALRVEGELVAKQNSAGEPELLVLGSHVDLVAQVAGHDIATLWTRIDVPGDGERAGGTLTRKATDAVNAVGRQERRRDELKAELAGYRARYGAPFPQEQEYVEKLAALERLRADLTQHEETIDPATLGVPVDPETSAGEAETTGPEGETDGGDRVEARRAKYGDDPYTVDLFGQAVRPGVLPPPDLNLDLEGPKAAPDLLGDANKKVPTEAPVSRLAAKVAQVRTGQITTAFPQVRSWDEAAHAAAQLRKFPQEHFLSLVLGEDGKILAALRHTIGVRDGANVSPSLVAGSIYAIPGARQVVFAHNHPSGVAQLSTADISIARKLYDLMKGTGVEPWGILAVGGPKYGYADTRFGEASGERERPITPGRRQTEVPILERVYRKAGRLSETTLSAPKKAVELADQLLPGRSGLLLLDNQHRPIGTLVITRDDLRQLRREGGAAPRILQAFHETNAAAAIFVNRLPALSEDDVQNLGKMISLSDVRFLDVVEPGGGESWSWSSTGKSLVGDLSSPDYYAAGTGFSEANIERNRTLVDGIRRTLAQVAPGANVEMLERIVGGEGMQRSGGAAGAFAAGSYTPVSSTIRVALNYRDPQQTAFHEAIHFLRQAGLFQPAEWAALERQAEKAWKARYGVTDTEEAVAYGAADYLRAPTDDVGGLVRKALNKLRQFFERLAGWLRGEGFRTWADVLRKVQAGEVGARTGGLVRNTEQLASAGAKTAPTFFSALRRAVEGLEAKAMPVPGWLGAIKGLVSAGKVKADEVAWTGLEDWLKLQTGRVSKAAVAEFLDAHGVQVQEVMLKEPSVRNVFDVAMLEQYERLKGLDIFPAESMDPDVSHAVEFTFQEDPAVDDPLGWDRVTVDEMRTLAKKEPRFTPEVIADAQAIEDYVAAGRDEPEGEGTPQFTTYTLPGGRDYRELLLTLPVAVSDTQRSILDEEYSGLQTQRAYYISDLQEATHSGSSEEQRFIEAELDEIDRAMAANREARKNAQAAEKKEFRSQHYDQPNILAHVRFDERTDAEGNRVLFVQEIQSDWAQKGKREGFAGGLSADEQERKSRIDRNENVTAADYDWYNRRINDATTPIAPFVQKTDAWVALVLKRVIREAAERGISRVAWTTGAQQAERYDLSKQVKRIQWFVRPNGTKNVGISMRDNEVPANLYVDQEGTITAVFSSGVGLDEAKGKRLDEVVGKEVADKILAASQGELSGEGLRVGGTGMRAFYDQIVPKVAKEVLKKLGGGAVAAVDLGETQQPGLTLPAAVLDKALYEGQALFSRGPEARYSAGTESPEADPFAEIDAAVRADTGWQRTGRGVRERWQALKGGAKRQMLGGLSVRQLAEVGREVLPGITEYVDHMQGMAATRTQIFDAADKIAQGWQKLDKNAVANRIQQGRLALVMHEATLAGVDPAEPYAPSVDVQEAIKQIGILKQQAFQRSGENQAQRLQDIAALKAKIGFERKRAEAYGGLVKLWDGLSPAAQAVYRRARDYHVEQMRRVEDALIETIEKSTLAAKAKAESIAKMRQEFEAWRVQAPYFPLSRDGEYWVYAKPADGPAEFHLFKTIEQQEDFRAEQARAGWEILGHGKQTENLREVVGVSAAFVDEIEKAIGTLGNDPMVNAVRDQVYQLYLATMPALSVRKHHIHRKKTPGFGQDALRAFAEKSYHDAYQYARLKHGLDLKQTMEDLRADIDAAGRPGKLAEAQRKLGWLTEFRDDVMGQLTAREVQARVDRLDAQALEDPGLAAELDKWRQFGEWMADWARRGGIPAQVARQIAVLERRQDTAARIGQAERGFDAATNVYNELQQAYQHLMTPNTSPAANLANQLGFMWYLGFSPSAWIVNALQTPLMSMPYVGAKFGLGKASAAFASAYRRAFTKDAESLFSIRGALSGDARAAYDEAVEMGLIDRTRAHDLAGLAEEGTARSGMNRTLMGVATAGFHHAERLNREVTFVAAYELAKGAGQSEADARAYAAAVVWKTHLDYAAENRPRMLRGNIARIIGQFKLYSQGVTYLLGKSVLDAVQGASPEVRAEAKRFLAYQFGLQFAAAGAMGLPIGAAWILAKGLLSGDDDEPEDFEGLFRQAMADWTGSTTGGAAASVGAVNALTPIDLHSRVSLRELWLREPDKAVEGKDGAYWVMTSIMGPMSGILANVFIGAQLINEGHLYRGIEKMLPNAANDAAKAVRFGTEGAKTLKGDELISDVTAAEVFATAAGFGLSRLEQRYAENSARKGVEQRIEDRRRLLLRQMVEARTAGETERVRALQAEIQAFNEANPTRKITPRSILQSTRTRARYRAQAEHGLALNPKLRGDLVERYRFAE